MEITLNNESKIIEQLSLEQLVRSTLGDKTRGIAVAVNQRIVPKNQWNSVSLKDKDAVLIIKATQGG